MKTVQRLLLIALVSLGMASGAYAQEEVTAPDEDAVHVLTYVEVSLDMAPQAVGTLFQYRNAVRAAPGSGGADVYREFGRAYRFVVREQWDDQAALDAFENGIAISELGASLDDMRTAPIDRRVVHALDIGPIRPPGGGRAKIHSFAHIAIPADRMDDFMALLSPFTEASRSDADGMRFDVWQEAAPRENQITIYESWSNPDAYEAHRTAAHTQAFRDGVADISSPPYDDRVYGRFDD